MNADVVLGADEPTEADHRAKWLAWLRRSFTEEEIHRVWLPLRKAHDHPARLADQLEWLTAAGFRQVRVFWKSDDLAVFGGRR